MGFIKKVFIVHGWTYSLEKWGVFTKVMARLGFSCVTLAVPGLTLGSNRVWSLDDYVGWLKEELDKESGKAIVVGHSNGGRIALAFAAKYPEKIAYLVLIDSAGIFHHEFPTRVKRFIFGVAAKIGKKVTGSESARRLLYRLAGESDYRNATIQMRQTMANLISVDLSLELGKITSPVLIIWGELDKITPISDGLLMHKLIKGSKLYRVKGARHSPYFTHTDEVCGEIVKEIDTG